jgi:hypothetical protein
MGYLKIYIYIYIKKRVDRMEFSGGGYILVKESESSGCVPCG